MTKNQTTYVDARGIAASEKFKIAFRDNFTCLFCGGRPGNENLEIDHLIPYSYCGSNAMSNLVTACKKCNRGKGTSIILPKPLCLGVDDEGWQIHKTWGIWAIKFGDGVFLTGAIYSGDPKISLCEYPIEIDRVHNHWWESHLAQKCEGYEYDNFCLALEYARSMTKNKQKKNYIMPVYKNLRQYKNVTAKTTGTR